MKNEGKRILVPGGGGFLGKAVVDRCLRRKDRVTSFSRKFHDNLKTSGVTQIQGDIADFPVVEQACRGMEIVFHIAAIAGIWAKYEKFYQTNFIGTRNIIEACIQNQVPYLVYTSSPSVIFTGSDMMGVDESVPYTKQFSAYYPKTKAMAEKAVRAAGEAESGLKTIILRPHLIWGPRDNHLVPGILSRGKHLARIGNGNNLVDTIYIDNAADAHLLAADCLRRNPELSGRIYFISQDDPVPLWDMVDAILEAGGLPPVNKSISPGIARLIGSCFERIYSALNIKKEPPMTRFLAEELSTSHWFDITAAKKDLGYFPAVSTNEGLRRLRSYLQR
jgi:nucleoside-diphosphate-sugar epimerase